MRGITFTPLKIALGIGLIAGLMQLAEPIDHIFWNTWFRVPQHSADGETIVVTLPAPGSNKANADSTLVPDEAEILNRIRALKPARVFLDLPETGVVPGVPGGALRGAIAEFGDTLTFIAHPEKQRDDSVETRVLIPEPGALGAASIAISAWQQNFFGYAINSPYLQRVGDKVFPTVGAVLANAYEGNGPKYFPDFALDPQSIPVIEGARLVSSNPPSAKLAGKMVIVANLAASSQEPIGWFGRGRVAPVFMDVAGSAQLKNSVPINIGWMPILLTFAALVVLGRRQSRRRLRLVAYGLAVALVVAGPPILEMFGIFSTLGPAFLAMASYGVARLWQKWRIEAKHLSGSGLPNFVALADGGIDEGADVIVGTISRYEEFLATLPRALHAECARQIAHRLSLGSGSTVIYHGGAGHFAWIEEAKALETQLSHLEGMRALFTAPLDIGGHTLDTNIHFGLDRNADQDATTRINSALASAVDAQAHVRLVEEFAPERLAEATWELSLNARIDEGLREGEIWLAYQAQWDHRLSLVRGAKALIRWNHPTRGAIPPDAFILQAERAGRIDTITYWVLDEAIGAALRFSEVVPGFRMSVNLSAQMVDKPGLVDTVAEIVRKRGIDSRKIVFEVTETWGMRNRPAAQENLSRLRALGFGLSIDDFGTGEASLAYLAEMPSDELKIDKRFVAQITGSERNRLIVQSTIALGHALGQQVVAEGVEDAATFAMLTAMDCDVSQGYFIGYPVNSTQFIEELVGKRLQLGLTLNAC